MDLRRIVRCVIVFLFLTAGIIGCNSTNSEKVDIQGDHITIRLDSLTLDLGIIRPDLLNVRYFVTGSNPEFRSLSCIERSGSQVEYTVQTKNDLLTVNTGRLKIRVNLTDGSIGYFDDQDKPVFSEINGKSKELKTNIAGKDTGYSVTHRFNLSPDEAIYGFGQYQDGNMNRRGKEIKLFQHNMQVALPVMISSAGYGIFWDNYSYSTFTDKPDSSTQFRSEMGDGLNYYFIYGPSTDSIISGIRQITGRVPMFPKWSFGFIQSKARYTDKKEIMNAVRKFRRLQVPLDLIVQDWQYWHEGWWGDKEYDPERFPDPGQMISDIHQKYNCHYMISIWPCLEPGSRDYEQLDSAGFLYPGNGRRYYDPFNPEARKLYWKQTNNGLFRYGVDAWWCDATEPEINGWETTVADYKSMMKPAIGSSTRYLNAYSLMQSECIYQGQRKTTDEKRVFNLTRSAFTGQQRYGAATWSGDVSANWQVFHNQIPAGLNFCITGIPYWTTDIGAFFVNDKEWFRQGQFPEGVLDPKYHEFFVRWYQYGAFSPLFRVHGAQTPREIWNFGKKGDWAYDIQVKFNNLRYRLLPYIYSVAGSITQDDYTIMRPLIMDFPEDKNIRNIDDQYMFGPAFLVNPVTTPGAKVREVYLPESAGGWFDFWTGEHHPGGHTITAAAPIDILPLFVRAGSIVPTGPFLQYSSEKKADPLEIRIYPGKDGSFTLYEDEGDNYDYEKDRFSLITFQWKDRDKMLKISERKGSFTGMVQNRTFNIVVVHKKKGTAVPLTSHPDKTVFYTGKPINVQL